MLQALYQSVLNNNKKKRAELENEVLNLLVDLFLLFGYQLRFMTNRVILPDASSCNEFPLLRGSVTPPTPT